MPTASFLSGTDRAAPYRESIASWYRAPQRPSVIRAGRWLNSQAPQPVRPGQTAESSYRLRLPVLEALELQRRLTTADRQALPPAQDADSSLWSRMPVLEATELHTWTPTVDRQPRRADVPVMWASVLSLPTVELAVELRHVQSGAEQQAPHPGLSWIAGVQIPAVIAGDLPLELRRFVFSTDLKLRSTEATAASLLWNRPRPAVKRLGRWISAQPRHPRIVPESLYQRSSILLVPPVNLPEQLRRFVMGQPLQSKDTEASWIWGIQIPNPPASGTILELQRWMSVPFLLPTPTDASWVRAAQIPTNADLYSVKRMIASHVGYRTRYLEAAGRTLQIPPFQDLPIMPVELRLFVVGDDAQPVPRATPALWIPQLQPSVSFPEELTRFVVASDWQRVRAVISWVAGVQVAEVNPPLPIELQTFVETNPAQPTQRGHSTILPRYVTPVPPLPIELLNFLLTEPPQRKIVPESRLMTRKIDEKVAMPVELRHFVETAFQRYRSHYLILKGNFEAAPVPDVQVEYKYFRGYTIITKKVTVH